MGGFFNKNISLLYMGLLDLPSAKLGKNLLLKQFTPTKNNTGVLSKFVFMDFCTPAKFYLIVALLTLIYYVSIEQAFVWIIIKAVLFIIWCFGLNKLCVAGYTSIAWLLAIVPQSIFILVTLRVTPALPPMPVTASPPR
jgi:hypothetical protein